uniref:Uncharacterized protein n=1 Tax=Aquisalinus luteolus TaxID=1566827 RepID=A0A8J3A1P7_9PROT|nr:hypothetical protein GCM10011355_13800 [Aquisalinus luteolus]
MTKSDLDGATLVYSPPRAGLPYLVVTFEGRFGTQVTQCKTQKEAEETAAQTIESHRLLRERLG